MRSGRHPRRARESGVALVIVLWVAALVTVLATGFAFTARTEAVLASGQVERARAAALAESGIRRGIMSLLAREEENRLRADGRGYTLALPGGEVVLRVSSENGKVDLNSAAAPLVEGLVRAAADGLADPGSVDVEAVTDALLDWRDSDHDRRPRGAEDDEYEAAGRPYGARDGAFASMSEVRRVLGVSAALYERIAGAATVYTWSGHVDPMTAPRLALLAVPGLDAARVDAFLEARALAGEDASAAGTSADPLQYLGGAERYLTRPRAAIYTLDARGETAGGAVADQRAVVRVTGNPRQPYAVLAWLDTAPKGGPDPDSPPAPETALP